MNHSQSSLSARSSSALKGSSARLCLLLCLSSLTPLVAWAQAGGTAEVSAVEAAQGEQGKPSNKAHLRPPKQEELAVENRTPKELDVDITERLGEKIPTGLSFKDAQGEEVQLKQYFGTGRPVLLTLVYYNCPMLCNLVLNGVLEGARELGWVPGQDYELVTLSISPNESPELALAKKKNYLEQLGIEGAGAGWHFLTGTQDNIKALADAVGFGYRYDPSTQDYAHGAAIFFLADDATITRYLYGITFPAKQLRLALTEAGRGEVGSLVDRVLLRCFMYEPSHKKYGFYIWGAMRMGGVAIITVLGLLLLILWRNDRDHGVAARAERET